METKFTYIDLLPAMIVGKKIRRKAWANNFFIQIPAATHSVVLSSYSEEVKLSRWEMTQTDWEIVEEPVEVKPELSAKDVEIFYTKGKIEGIKALRARYGKKPGTDTYIVGLKEAKELFDVLPTAPPQDYNGLSAYDWYHAAKGHFEMLERDHPMLKVHLMGTLMYGDYLVWREQQ